jgi:hypothetical protein
MELYFKFLLAVFYIGLVSVVALALRKVRTPPSPLKNNGHKRNEEYPGLCANCGLGRAYWAETCAPRVVDLSGRLSPFSESDVAWLRSLQIATPNEEPVLKG